MLQHSCVHSNLFYCSDNADLAKRDAALRLACFCFSRSSSETTMSDVFITFSATSGVKVERERAKVEQIFLHNLQGDFMVHRELHNA